MKGGLLEALAFVVGPGWMAWLTWRAAQGTLLADRVTRDVQERTSAEVLTGAAMAITMYLLGVLVLAAARLFALRRGRRNVPVPLLLPALCTLVGLGLAVQMGYGDPRYYGAFRGLSFGGHALAALGVAALVVASPLRWSPQVLASRHPQVVLLAMLVAFVALVIDNLGSSGQMLDIRGFQPLDFVKVAFALWLGTFLGKRSEKLRWHRKGPRWLRWPRPDIVLPASIGFVGVVVGLLVVRDMGPMGVVGAMFLVMFTAVTRSYGWAVAAVGVMVGVLAVAMGTPLLGDNFAERVAIWRDPWLNGLPRTQEVAFAAWSLAAGGWTGQGAGASLTILPWGHNDLVLAQLGEDHGWVGLVGWTTLLCLVVWSACVVTWRGRLPEIQLASLGVASLLTAQSAIIFIGVMGLGPLTGIVAPFVAQGGSALVAFTLAGAVVARMAEDGDRVGAEPVMLEIGKAGREFAVIVGLLWLGAGWASHQRTVAWAEVTSLRPTLAQLRDGTFVLQHNPRLWDVARGLKRGEILDRAGKTIAGTAPDGQRTYPLGDALGTVLGVVDVVEPPWALEVLHDHHLRGYPDLPGELVVTSEAGGSAPGDGWRPRYVTRVEEGAASTGPRLRGPPEDPKAVQVLIRPDLSRFLPILRMDAETRRAVVRSWQEDVPARSVTVSLDADLQREVAARVRKHAAKGLAAAAAVLDVDTGKVLARAQWPDFDPAEVVRLRTADWRAWRELQASPTWHGPYGQFGDKTGMRGRFQSGSIFKLYSALSAVSQGVVDGRGRDAGAYPCTERDSEGPMFTRPGWRAPIHDFSTDPNHGHPDLATAIAVSCNVYFGQLGLALGNAGLSDLAQRSVTAGLSETFNPGVDGSRTLASTAFGQGAAAMHVLGAARLTAAVGADGVYPKCAPTMLQGEVCERVDLLAPSAGSSTARQRGSTTVILEGMRRVLLPGGTGSRLKVPSGLRIYGKTGTADSVRFPGEEHHGVASQLRAHSWFVALVEPEGALQDLAASPGRVSIAAVVPRGGTGAGAAGPLVMDLAAAVRDLGLLTSEGP